MENDALNDADGARRVASMRVLLLAQLPPLFMALLAVVVGTFVGVRLIGVWPTVVIGSPLRALHGFAISRVRRLRRQR